MKKVNVFIDDNDKLNVSVSQKQNDNKELFNLEGENALNYLSLFKSDKLLNVIETADDIDVIFEYANYSMELKNYSNFLTHEKYKDVFIPLFKNAIRVLQQKNNKIVKVKKVTRKNKYDAKRIIATALITTIIASVGSVSFHKDNLKEKEALKYGSSTPTSSQQIVDKKESSFKQNKKQTTKSKPEEAENLSNTIDKSVNEVHLDYNDRSGNQDAIKTRSNYTEIIDKYSKMYGLDSNLVLAIATQERGVHSETMDEGGATGLMQIQNSVWDNEPLSAYNFETNSEEQINVISGELGDLNYNVKVGCMIFQDDLKRMNYNIPAAIQSYNMGYNSVYKMIDQYCIDTNKTREEVLKDQSDVGWLDYRYMISFGDPDYIEHVLSYCSDNSISVTDPENNIHSITTISKSKNKTNI